MCFPLCSPVSSPHPPLPLTCFQDYSTLSEEGPIIAAAGNHRNLNLNLTSYIHLPSRLDETMLNLLDACAPRPKRHEMTSTLLNTAQFHSMVAGPPRARVRSPS